MRARFWRNVTFIALAHVALLLVLLHGGSETRAADPPEITWLSGGAELVSAETDTPDQSSPIGQTPEPVERPQVMKSEIVLQNQTPSPTATPRATSKNQATATLKPKKRVTPKAVPAGEKPAAKKKEVAVKNPTVAAVAGRGAGKKDGAKRSTGGAGDETSGTGSGKSDVATANYYSDMLHDRFYRAWEQPQTVVASGVKLSAVARIRIEKDGHVSNFKIVKPSGNVLVDESVQSAGKKVSQVDALPAGIGSGGYYDVNINFALNSE